MVSSQEDFWRGDFGDKYILRNNSAALYPPNLRLFSEIINSMEISPKEWIEFGPNIGNNLKAIKTLIPNCKTIGIEINSTAAQTLKNSKVCDLVINKSIFDLKEKYFESDVSMSKGVLIHLDPELLQKAYEVLYKNSRKYILLIEYYNPTPVEVTYRGNNDRLFKRDFAGEMMEKYSDLTLVRYGFRYHKDKTFPQDDLTWFLLKK